MASSEPITVAGGTRPGDLQVSPDWQGFPKIPSSNFQSYRSTSTEVDQEGKAAPKEKWWKSIKKSVVDGAMVAVGLEPTRDESRHWDLVKSFLLDKDGEEETDGAPVMRTSHHPRDRSILRHVSQREFQPTSSMIQPDSEVSSKSPFLVRQLYKHSGSQQPMYSVRSYKQNKSTGRNQAIRTDLKPDLWKVAFNSLRTRSKRPEAVEMVDAPSAKVMKSFMFEDEDEEEDVKVETDGPPSSPLAGLPIATILEHEDEYFFDEDMHPTEETDSGLPARGPPSLTRMTSLTVKVQPDSTTTEEKEVTPDSDKTKRGGRIKEIWGKVTLSGGYLSGYGGLGGISKLLSLEYKKISRENQQLLDAQFLHKRPYFTYWLMVVHLVVMIIALAVYGFAPYGWDLIERRAIVRQTDLSSASVSKMVVPSVWGGPPQQALVLLGAIFAPCMRRDRQLFMGIEEDRSKENTTSGCCVHRDGSGCFQTTSSFCQPRFSDFVTEVNDTRAVCGTSPNTCLEPSRTFSASIWDPQDILTWPVCFLDSNDNATDPHLTCEVTSRPCCYSTQANCIITTREQCDFLSGRFHQEAFLCLQVDCLNDICGLLPFREFNQPDQFYRLWLAIFLHAGLVHLVLSLLFSFFVLRHVEKRLGWLRTCIIFILSGIGGNLVSAYFAPYNPEVGPAGSILGIVAYFFVFLLFESRLLLHPWKEFLKLGAVCLALFLLGLIPYIDNYAHIGGFVFGFLISGVLIPYGKYKEGWRITGQDQHKDEYYLVAKMVLIMVGLVGLVLLFILFFVLLYVVQSTWIGFSYVTCIPFTSTLCVDQQAFIRDRNQVII